MKKRICGIITFIKEMEGKFFLLALVCGLIVLGIAAIDEPSFVFVENKEESYQALEEVANNICNQKNTIQPLNENLKKYEISSKENGTVNIKLYSHDNLILDVMINEEYQILSLERKVFLVEYCMGVFLSFTLVGTIITAVLYMVVLSISAICIKCRKQKEKD